jgi:hypothetical protein
MFGVMALSVICLEDGTAMVQPGVFGLALLKFAGRRPGYVVVWDGGQVVQVYADEMGLAWVSFPQWLKSKLENFSKLEQPVEVRS